jgi:hypothetical protein
MHSLRTFCAVVDQAAQAQLGGQLHVAQAQASPQQQRAVVVVVVVQSPLIAIQGEQEQDGVWALGMEDLLDCGWHHDVPASPGLPRDSAQRRRELDVSPNDQRWIERKG